MHSSTHREFCALNNVFTLGGAQQRIRELQEELDKRASHLTRCQEECSSIMRQLVSGQQKTKELTIENLDLKESLKTCQEVQKELTTEVRFCESGC